jgi:outer membrane murein-binding lipoprotein Lpp
MDRIRVATILGLLCLAGGCADRTQVATLEKKAADLESQVEALKASVQQLQQQKSFDQLLRDLDSVAYLTPGSNGYSIVQTDLGRMTVALENVQPYANGTRITLRFGNLTSATVNGAKARVEWGSADAKGVPKNETARSRDVSFSESLRAGTWTNVLVVLEGVPPTELGFVRIKDVTHTGISLLK